MTKMNKLKYILLTPPYYIMGAITIFAMLVIIVPWLWMFDKLLVASGRFPEAMGEEEIFEKYGKK